MNGNDKTKSFAIQKRVTLSNTRCVFVFIEKKTMNQRMIKLWYQKIIIFTQRVALFQIKIFRVCLYIRSLG